eukprot:UN20701
MNVILYQIASDQVTKNLRCSRFELIPIAILIHCIWSFLRFTVVVELLYPPPAVLLPVQENFCSNQFSYTRGRLQ